jgi:hypothetical protein
VRGAGAIPFEPYAPIRDQVQCIVREVNRRRKAAGVELIAPKVVFRERKPVKPFVPLSAALNFRRVNHLTWGDDSRS